jgi:hypothetical protein
MKRIQLGLALLLAPMPAAAQEITQGVMMGSPIAYGQAVVSYTQTTLAVGKYTANVAVPGTQVGDLVFVMPNSASGLTVGSILQPYGHVTADGTVQITWDTPGLVSVSLGTISLRFRWLRFPN